MDSFSPASSPRTSGRWPAAGRLPYPSAVAGVVILALLTALDLGGHVVLWSNLMWLLAAAIATVQALTAADASTPEARRIQLLFRWSVGTYLAGQVTWAVQTAVDFQPMPGPSDVAFLTSGGLAAWALLRVLREQIAPGERRFVAMDAGVMMFAAAVALVALRTAPAFLDDPWVALTLLAYPVVWTLPAASAVLVVLGSRDRSMPVEGRILVLGWLAIGLGFLGWTEFEVRGLIFPGHVVDYLYPLGLLLVGRGLASWRQVSGELLRIEPNARRLLDALPIAWIAAAVASYGFSTYSGGPDQHHGLLDLLLAALVALVTVRQYLLARRRRRLLERELEANARADVALARERATRERLELMANTLDDAFRITDAETGEVRYQSSGFERVFGTRGDAIVEEPARFFDLVHPSDRERVWRRFASRLETGGFDEEYRVVWPDGTVHTVRDRHVPVPDDEGNVRAFVSVATDTTEATKTHQVGALLAEAIEQANESVVITDASHRTVYANPAATRSSGYPVEELLGRDPAFLSSGALGREHQDSLRRTLEAGGLWRGVFFNRRKDGSPYEEQAVVVPVRHRLSLDDSVNYVAVKRDMTELREMEGRLLEAQKMEAIGQLAGGIAHDFNNLLTVILNCAELAVEELREGDPAREHLGEVSKAGYRAAHLTTQLLAFSRRQMLVPKTLDLRATVRDLAALVGRLLPKTIALETRVAEELPAVLFDPEQLDRVLMNLVANARDAMPEGGTLTLEVSPESIVPGDANLDNGSTPGNYVRITVRDTGIGMDAATSERIFEPFFTTKEVGKGTGLGLSTAFGIVRQSGGTIHADSERGRGTAIHVLLPAVSEGAVGSETDAASTGSLGDRRPAACGGAAGPP